MKQDFTSQEILLITGTTFASRQWCKNDDTEKSGNNNENDMLQEACWNGLIGEMLPELASVHDKEPMYLWKVNVGQSFIELELGQSPRATDRYFSLDPYSFIDLQSKN